MDPLADRRVHEPYRRPYPESTPLPTSGTYRSVPARVCIATSDLVGPVRNGGVGTACTTLAEALAAAGDDVTIVFVGPFEAGDRDVWREHYARKGVTFVTPDTPPFPLEAPHHARASYFAYTWLAQQPRFDVIHFPEINGVGFYALVAKRLGLGFEQTCLAVTLHSPTLWHRLENHEALLDTEDLVLDFMERECVAQADVLISPTTYLVRWVADWGFLLPAHVYVQPNLTSVSGAVSPPPFGPPEELVFFGRLETRKGLELFCDALEHLAGSGCLTDTRLTFLGKVGRVGAEDGANYARRRCEQLGLRPHIHTDLDQEAALAYLRGARGLAVMPSLADNLPYTVVECLAEGLPFLTTRVGGIPECIYADDQATVLCEPEARALASRISEHLHQPPRTVRPSVDAALNLRQWMDWHHQLQPGTSRDSSTRETPMVSVCIATRNRPAHLRTALASLLKQTYASVEVVVVDDASDRPLALGLLDTLTSEFGPRGWQILRSEERRGPGAARNRAAVHARGEYLLFMDDDNIARPEEIATFVRAAQHSELRLLTCVVDHFEDRRPEDADLTPLRRWLPLGPALVPGLFSNQFGDTNFFIARDLFMELGGFDEDPAAAFVEDWLFLSRAAMRGVEWAVVPVPLFWYRIWPDAHGQGRPASQSLFRRLRPYLASQPPDRRALTLLAAGSHERILEQTALEHIAQARTAALRARYEKATPWLSVGPADDKRVRAERDLEISATAGGLLLEARGDDPIAWLPGTAPAGVHSIARIDITAPAASCMQLFWSTRDVPYPTEEHSVLAPTGAGRHVVWVEIPAAEHVGCLRFDPSFKPGNYVLHALEIRHEGKPGEDSASAGWISKRPALQFVVERLRRAAVTLVRKTLVRTDVR